MVAAPDGFLAYDLSGQLPHVAIDKATRRVISSIRAKVIGVWRIEERIVYAIARRTHIERWIYSKE
jgi:hypothetical protein